MVPDANSLFRTRWRGQLRSLKKPCFAVLHFPRVCVCVCMRSYKCVCSLCFQLNAWNERYLLHSWFCLHVCVCVLNILCLCVCVCVCVCMPLVYKVYSCYCAKNPWALLMWSLWSDSFHCIRTAVHMRNYTISTKVCLKKIYKACIYIVI